MENYVWAQKPGASEYKGKVPYSKQRSRVAYAPYQGREPVGGNTTIVCERDAIPTVTFAAYAGTKVILLGDRGACVFVNNLPMVDSTAWRSGFERATY